MPTRPNARSVENGWTPVDDPIDRYSSGIPDFDRLLGGGFSRGSLALFDLDESVGPAEWDLLFTPTLLNFLYQSRGILAVLPARDSPHAFRERLTRFATKRRFDSRVRVVDYVGEDDGLPYVVSLKAPLPREQMIARMEKAHRAAKGERQKPFLEVTSVEILETLFGPDAASKMYLHGVKRARDVGNLVLGVLRPGLSAAPSLRAMADTEFHVRREEVGVVLRGIRPSFANHVVIPDPSRPPPHVSFVPRP